MKPLPILAVTLAVAGIPFMLPQDEQVDALQLKKMVEGLGYTTKFLSEDKGKEKFEFPTKTDGFDVPIAGELSASKNYIWLTVFLGPAGDDTAKHSALLKANQRVQPNFFYITDKNNLMLGIAVDNRSLNPAALKRIVDKLSADVGKTADVWNK